MPVNGQNVKFEHYSRSKFNSLTTKDPNTLYYVKDTNGAISHYVGNELVGNELIKITYSELKTLRNTSKLQEGVFYRITDYETTCNYNDVEVANHYFDIIVQALDEKTLSQNASAIERAGQTYYKNNNANLSAWELKYDIDNDNTKYDWAVSNGKGVIFGMKDDKGNEVGYDFKNIKFRRMFNASGAKFINRFSISGTGTPMYFYLFSVIDENGLVNDSSVKLHSNDEGILQFAKLNRIAPYFEQNYDVNISTYKIGNNTMIYDYNYYGYWEFNGFNNNTIGNDFYSNTIGHYFNDNTIGNYFSSNTIGEYFNNNTIGNEFYSNTIGDNFRYNTIGDSFNNNTIGDSFNNNTIGIGFRYNTIGNYLNDNTIGNYNRYLKTVDGAWNQRIQFIHIENGVSGNSTSNPLDLTNTGTILTGNSQTTPTIISKDSSGWLMLKRSGLTFTGKRKTTISGSWGDL